MTKTKIINTRSGFAAIIGAPNAGKSMFLNKLVGSKISIVTHKAQTTRSCTRGITIEASTQVVFVDTPGVFQPRRRLDRAMISATWIEANNADVIITMIDAKHGLNDHAVRVLDGLRSLRNRTVVLALNKIDALREKDRERMLNTVTKLQEMELFADIFMISAMNGSGISQIKQHISKLMPIGHWHYPKDQLSDVPMRSLAAEITREKLFLLLHDELPYSLTVETESYDTKKDGSIRIQQIIFVQRESQRKILLGEGGQMIKTVGQLARKDLQKMLGAKVHIFLFVKVREAWGDDIERYREMGLSFPKDQTHKSV